MKKLFLYTVGCLLLSACSDELGQMEVPAGELVEVSLSLAVEDEAMGTPAYEWSESRAVIDKETDAATDIKNLWVIQFNGTTDEAIIVGSPTYIENFQSAEEKKVKLLAASEVHTIVFIANTFDGALPLSAGKKLTDVKELTKTLTADGAGLFGSDAEGDHIMFNGSTLTTIADGTEISGTLQRNIARIDFTLRMHTADVTITSAQLRSVPAVSHYLTSHLTTGTETIPVADGFSTIRIDPQSSSVATTEGVETHSYRFYTPANQRGPATSTNDNEVNKNLLAPYGATYILVNGTYKENGKDIPVAYTFYLGANLTNDFNLRPNYAYTYTIDIQGIGDIDSDARIHSWGDKKFFEDANCYILNPIPFGTASRTFRIPVKRIDEFWGNSGYENEPNNCLGDATAWVPEVVWADFAYTGQVDINADGMGKTGYVKVDVAPGTSGNMVVGVKLADTDGKATGNYLWSWHLWITDYMPDDASKIKIPESRNVYVFPVTGGDIHRYAGSSWQTGGTYANSFIMDRNVGALSTAYVGTGLGVLYYQFGRKDPFPGNVSLKGPNNTTPVVETVDYLTDYKEGGTLGENIRNAVHHPLHFYKTATGYWTTEETYHPSGSHTFLWQDKEVTDLQKKSIFDPCPSGWCLPSVDVWVDFTTGNTSFSNNGLYYEPDKEAEVKIYYPASGSRGWSQGTPSAGSGFYWSSTPTDQTFSKALFFTGAGLNKNTYDERHAVGTPVRCVKQQ